MGLRDREAGLPVTQDTLFAIGSVTKSFTATAIGALVDEGLLEWDRPLRDYVPGVRLHDSFVSDRLTIVDLLSHRSGLPRHDLTCIGQPGRSRAEIVRSLRFLPLSRDLRQEFQYCNLGYLVAGHVVEVLSGAAWEDFVRGRLLGPLGMRRSNVSVDEMLADDDHAAAYTRRDGVIASVPQRPLPAVAPAGAINSSAADMARWLLAQLAGGQLDGAAVMSPGTAERQLTPHMLMPDPGDMPGLTQYAYGLGWSIGRYREHRIAMHSGGIDGFTTHCMLLPDDGIGVVVLTNTSSSLMPLVVACRVAGRAARGRAAGCVRLPQAALRRRDGRDGRGQRRPPGRPRRAAGPPAVRLRRRVRAPGLRDPRHRARPGRPQAVPRHHGPEPGPPALRDVRPHVARDGRRADGLPAHVPVRPRRRYQRPHRPVRAEGRTAAVRQAPGYPGPEVLRGLCGSYAMGPIELAIGLRGERTLTVTAPGSPPLDLEPIRGLRFGVKGQPAVTAEFELDDNGAVTRLIAQPMGIFFPKEAT